MPLIRGKGVVRPAPAPHVPPMHLMSVQEAATYAKVSTQTIRRAIKAGELKAYRAGRQLRIDESDLVHWLSPDKLEWL